MNSEAVNNEKLSIVNWLPMHRARCSPIQQTQGGTCGPVFHFAAKGQAYPLVHGNEPFREFEASLRQKVGAAAFDTITASVENDSVVCKVSGCIEMCDWNLRITSHPNIKSRIWMSWCPRRWKDAVNSSCFLRMRASSSLSINRWFSFDRKLLNEFKQSGENKSHVLDFNLNIPSMVRGE